MKAYGPVLKFVCVCVSETFWRFGVFFVIHAILATFEQFVQNNVCISIQWPWGERRQITR